MNIISTLQEISPIIVALCTITITIFAIKAYNKIDPIKNKSNTLNILTKLTEYYQATNIKELITKFHKNEKQNMVNAQKYIDYKNAIQSDSLSEEARIYIEESKEFKDFIKSLWVIIARINQFQIMVEYLKLEDPIFTQTYMYHILILTDYIDTMKDSLKTEEYNSRVFPLGFDKILTGFSVAFENAKTEFKKHHGEKYQSRGK